MEWLLVKAPRRAGRGRGDLGNQPQGPAATAVGEYVGVAVATAAGRTAGARSRGAPSSWARFDERVQVYGACAPARPAAAAPTLPVTLRRLGTRQRPRADTEAEVQSQAE
jgi:hypothetical protein